MAEFDVVVVGAGVIGLTTAVCLAEAGARVRCLSAAPPRETTSRVAGALWGASFFGPAGQAVRRAEGSLAEFRILAEVPESGVRIARGTLASRHDAEPPPPELFPGVELRPRAEPLDGFAGAYEGEVPLVDMERHLGYLEQRLLRAGAMVELRRIASFEEAAATAPVVVNCSGLGARELVPDGGVEAVRGQHVVVDNPGLDEFFVEDARDSEWACWFAHGDRVVLGGVAQPDRFDLEPDLDVARGILDRCAAIEPRFRGARVREHLVGLRPFRASVRVEEETDAGFRCIHNYGHGGTGVGLSWGCAREVEAIYFRR
jgi:D-amino-acid oxidase